MPAPELYLILNPAADRGRAARLGPRLESLLREVGARGEIVLTEGRGHATELAETAARAGRPAVVAVGGDGVVHEVANGLMRAAGDAPTIPLGVIGHGTGNDFIKLLGLPSHDPAAALRRIVAATPRAVDIGAVTRCEADRGPAGPWWFTNGIGLGFDAQVAVQASRIRRVKGLAVYAIALARTLRSLGAPRIRVTVDGVEVADRRLVLTTIANGACHGGSFWLTPDARIDDGLLDILVADARSVAAVVRLIPRVLRGRIQGLPAVAQHRGTRVEVRSDEPLPIHADGEIVAAGVRALDVEIVRGRLMVLA